MQDDNYAWPIMVDLAACLCGEIENSDVPPVCECGVIHGSTVSLDYCGQGQCDGECGGQAWVRPVDIYPSVNFPNRDTSRSNCNSPLAVRIEIGIVRCVPVGRNNPVGGYTPPTKEELEASARLQMADMAVMYRAISCCFGGTKDVDYFVEAYTPLVPQGGCGGGAFTVVVQRL